MEKLTFHALQKAVGLAVKKAIKGEYLELRMHGNPGKGFKRYAHGWGKNIKFVRVKGRLVILKRDPVKESVFVSDYLTMCAPRIREK